MTNESPENQLPEVEQPNGENAQPVEETPAKAPEKAPSSTPVETASQVKKPAAAKAAKPVEKPAARKKATPGAFFSASGLMLLEILLPVILTSVLLWWLFATLNIWSTYNRTLVTVVFAVAMVAISLLLSIMFDSATRFTRKKQRAAGVRFTSAPLARLVKLVLGGVVLPLSLFAAASLVPLSAPLPSRGTLMNYIITSSVQPVKVTPPDEVGSIALESKDPATKVLSIQVLQGFKSPQALGQLIRLVSEDKSGLSDPAVADALSTAIASYGKDARDPLIVMFKSVDPVDAGGASTGDLYTSYFTGSFDQLKSDIKSSGLTPAEQETRLAQIDSAAAQLKMALKDLPSEKVSGDPRPSFALKTLLATGLTEDPDLLSFAKSIAQDQRYPASLRGDALLLIGKLGAKSDLDGLYSYLKESNPAIQNRALQAIVDLQAKLSGTAAK